MIKKKVFWIIISVLHDPVLKIKSISLKNIDDILLIKILIFYFLNLQKKRVYIQWIQIILLYELYLIFHIYADIIFCEDDHYTLTVFFYSLIVRKCFFLDLLTLTIIHFTNLQIRIKWDIRFPHHMNFLWSQNLFDSMHISQQEFKINSIL